jgi:outer membrane protein assembly factor BamE (lipoprotein component of BamABCDE complex)
MKKLIITVVVCLIVGCSGPLINLSSVNSGMTKQEVIHLLGAPEGSSFKGDTSYLYFNIHDHAFGRDKNRYVFAFRNDKLVEFAPLPEDQQEMGPIDRALRRPRIIFQ